MDQNNKKNSRPNGGKNSNWRGLLSLISWALLLTIIVSYATSYMNSAGHRASSVTLEYGDFQQMVIAGDVQSVDFDNEEEILLITPVDGYVYTAPALCTPRAPTKRAIPSTPPIKWAASPSPCSSSR